MTTILKMLSLVKEKYSLYEGSGAHVILFLACLVLLFLLICKNRDKLNDKIDRRLFGYSLLSLFIYACPVTAYIIVKFCVGKSVYWRMFWLFPITLILAYLGTRAVEDLDKTLTRIIGFLAVSAIIVIAGQNMFRSDIFSPSTNPEKLPQAAIDVTDAIKADAGAHGIDTVKGAFDPSLCCYIRQYDGTIKMAFGREAERSLVQSDVYDAIVASDGDTGRLLAASLADNCNYIILPEGNTFNDGLINEGCRVIDTLDGYVIYNIA